MRPMNRETVNIVRSPISVEGNIRLVPYYPAYDTALAWYQDAQLCKQVDNRDSVYDLPLLKRMYHYLDTHGELFYIEYRPLLQACSEEVLIILQLRRFRFLAGIVFYFIIHH